MARPRTLPHPAEHPQIIPLLPFISAAWTDGTLTRPAMKAICSRLDALGWLHANDRAAAQAWLNPEDPPSPANLEALRRWIRTSWPASATPPQSLAAVGLELELAASIQPTPWASDEGRRGLMELEAELGLVCAEAARDLVGGTWAPTPSPAAPLCDPARFRGFLDSSHIELRDEVLEVLATPEFDFGLELPRAEYRERVLEAVRALADKGYGALAFPEACGGQDDPGAMLAAFETLAYGDLNVLVKFGVQFGLFGGSILQLGTEAHHRAHLGEVGSLELPGCFAMTEVGHGSNVRDLETVATFDPTTDELVVHTPSPSAVKDWIGNAALHGRLATVFAQLDVDGTRHGVHALMVPIRDGNGSPLPGVTITDCGPKVGLNGVDNGRLAFEQVRVPRANLLDRFGRIADDGTYESPIPSAGRRFFTMLGTLVAGRISIAAASVSTAKRGLTVAVRYGGDRLQFGPAGEAEVPLLDYTVHQRLLMPLLAKTYALHFAVRSLADAYAAAGGQADPEIEVEAAGLKAVASWHAAETLQACREACGGKGYGADALLGRTRADQDVFTTFEGANVVLLQLAAKGLLSEFKEHMGDLKLWGIVRYVADRAGTRVAEMNPVITRRTDEDHLLDPEFHTAALEYREERLLASLGRRLKALLDGGADTFEAVNAAQDHMVSLAKAHVDRVALANLQAAVIRAPSPGISEALRTVCELFALSTIEADRAWYLEASYMDPPKTRAIRTLVTRLCGETREQARLLVDAFGIPDGVLKAPIATRE